jgi:predicted kinase
MTSTTAAKRTRLYEQAQRLSSLYETALASGAIDMSHKSVIDDVFRSVFQKLGVQPQPQQQHRLPAQTTFSVDYAALLRPWAIRQYRMDLERTVDEVTAEITALTTPPSDWQGTKKAYDATINRDVLAGLRSRRDQAKTAITRAKNGEVDVADIEPLSAIIERERTATNGTPTAEQIRLRLQELLAKAFYEESLDEQFYPTPDDIIDRYVVSQLNGDERFILEPSAGRGNIANKVRERLPEATIETVEINPIRREILHLMGYPVIGDDFMALGVLGKDSRNRPQLDPVYLNRYDAVTMNPPFAKGIGMAHVLRAIQMLRPGGKLIAVVPESYAHGVSRESADFQSRLSTLGEWTSNVIRADEYNREHDRKITIAITVIVFTKRAETIDQPDDDTSSKDISEWSNERIELPVDSGGVDTSFVPPNIVLARAAITQPPKGDYIPAYVKAMPFIREHVHFGVNKAIEALERTGGFLLADGTGTGKTLQCLLTAEYYWRKTKRPVIVFTVDKRVMQTSFFDDAMKLGWSVPDRVDVTTTQAPPKPRNYSGLYDDGNLEKPIVYAYQLGDQPKNGINVTTYNDLSQFDSPKITAAQQAIRSLQERAREVSRTYSSILKDRIAKLDQSWPIKSNGGKEKGYKEAEKELRDKLFNEYMVNDPVWPLLLQAQRSMASIITEEMSSFFSSADLVIFDEAHKIKNAGDGVDLDSQSIRARLGMAIINTVPRVMYVTATPADRPFDVLYLKKMGFWRDESEFKSSMQMIGYEWTEPLKNDKGEVIRDGRWSMGSSRNMDPFRLYRANAEMRRIFQWATEDGLMIRREIELTNLTVNNHKVDVNASVKDTMDSIIEAYTEEDSNGRRRTDWAAAFMVMMQELETYKLSQTIEIVDAAVQKGRQVIVFCLTTDEGEEIREATGTTKPGTVRTLKEALEHRYGEGRVGVIMGTTGRYEEYRRLENVRRFQSGEMRVLIGTISSGGTGLNLDDTTGRNPREMVIMTAPLSFINAMQGLGRIVRANTKSRSVAHFVYAKGISVDEWLERIMTTKFLSLNAIVEGESSKLNPSQTAELDDTGESGAMTLIAASTAQDSAQSVRRHPLLVKSNRRWEGWTMLSNKPFWVEVSGTPKNTTLAIGGRVRADLDTFVADYADVITNLGLKPNIDRNLQRYRGSFYGRFYDDRDERYMRDLETLLNVIDPRVQGQLTGKPFEVGTAVITREPIDHAGVPTGVECTIVVVRNDPYGTIGTRYDVELHDGRVVKSIPAHVFMPRTSAQSLVAQVGDVFRYYAAHASDYRSDIDDYAFRRAVRVTAVSAHEVTLESRTWVEGYPEGAALPMRASNYYVSQYRGRNALSIETADVETVTIDVIDFAEARADGFKQIFRGDFFGILVPEPEPNPTAPDVSPVDRPYPMVADDIIADASCSAEERQRRTLYRRAVPVMRHAIDHYGNDSPEAWRVRRIIADITGPGAIHYCETCPPKARTGDLCTTATCVSKLENACEQGAQTLWAYAEHDGERLKIDARRADLHRNIVEEVRSKAQCLPEQRKPIALLTGGPPASGKSHWLKEAMPDLLKGGAETALHVDVDEIRSKIPEYRGWNATLTHEESNMIVNDVISAIGKECKTNVIIDGTFTNERRYRQWLELLRSMGYATYATFFRVDKGTSKQRVLDRYRRTGRYVPSYVIEDIFSKGTRPFEALRDTHLDGWVVVDGETGAILERGGAELPFGAGRLHE